MISGVQQTDNFTINSGKVKNESVDAQQNADSLTKISSLVAS